MAGWHPYYYDPMPPYYYDYGRYYMPPIAFAVPAAAEDAESKKAAASKKPADAEKPKEAEKKSKVIEMDVPLCCDYCVRKVQRRLRDMDGVDSVNCDQWEKKVTVFGDANPEKVLKKVQRVRREAKLVTKKK